MMTRDSDLKIDSFSSIGDIAWISLFEALIRRMTFDMVCILLFLLNFITESGSPRF